MSLEMKKPAILPMSSRKRMTLNKTRLTNNRNPALTGYSCYQYQNKDSSNFHIHTKRANSCIPIQKSNQKHWGRARIIFLSEKEVGYEL